MGRCGVNELDPAIAAAARRMNDSIDRLVDARLRLERTPIDSFEEPRPISDGVMFSLAELPNASPELKRYAERVRNGECFWSEIETRSRPVPREVAELKASPAIIWYPPKPRVEPRRGPYRIAWE